MKICPAYSSRNVFLIHVKFRMAGKSPLSIYKSKVSSMFGLWHVQHVIMISSWLKGAKHGKSLNRSFMHFTSIHIPLARTRQSHQTTRQLMKWSLAHKEKEIGSMNSQPVSATFGFWNNHAKSITVINEYPRWFIEQFSKQHSLSPGISSRRVSYNSYQY